MLKAHDSRFSRDLHIRWVLAICILAFLLLGNAGLIAKAIRKIESDAVSLNYSGRQRMLVERTPVISRLLIRTINDEEIENLKQLLSRAAELIEEQHLYLINKMNERDFLRSATPESLRNLYFGEPLKLDEKIVLFIQHVRSLAESETEALTRDNPSYQYIVQAVKTGDLLIAMEALEQELQKLSNERIRGLIKVGQIMLAGNLLIILLIALLIFRPMARRVAEKTRGLETANRMLEKHAQDLEKSRRAALNIMKDVDDARQAAEQAQERLKLVIDSAPNAILMANAATEIVLANSMAEHFTGRPQAEILGSSFKIFFPEKFHGILLRMAEACSLSTSKQLICMEEDLAVLRADGGRIFVEVRLSSIKMEEGDFVLLSIVDMTERRRAEQLRASEERFRGVIEQAGEALLLSDETGRLAEVNQRACESLGYSRDELLRLFITDVDVIFEKESYRTFFEQLRRSKSLMLERVFQKKDRSIFPVETHCGMIEIHGRQYLLSLVRDITERKRAENELREMSLALANAVEGISRYDAEGRCVMANKSFLDMFGFSGDEAQGMPLADTVLRDDKKHFETALQAMRQQGKGEAEVRAMRKDGSLFNNQMVMIKTYDERNQDTGFYCFMKDITERKYKESLDIKSELISMVAHELRTPLHSVREGISVMLEGLTGDINAEQTDVLVTTKSSVDRLVRLVNSVLDFQRLEAGIVEFRLEENNINDIILESVKTTEPLAKSKGLTYEVALAENPPLVVCDRDRIMQVLVNLINNAIKFTSEGKVIVRAFTEGERVRVAVEDTGIGIKKDDIPKLFRKFGQLESGKIAAPGGTGLGLVISSRIIKEHQSELTVESIYKKGSSFSFTLPTADVSVKVPHQST